MATCPEDRLGREDAPGVADDTLPDTEGQAEHAPTAAAFVAAVYGDAGPGPAGRAVGEKRKAVVSGVSHCVSAWGGGAWVVGAAMRR